MMATESTKPESKQVSEMDTKEDIPSISKQDIHSHIPTAVFVVSTVIFIITSGRGLNNFCCLGRCR